MAKRTSSLSFHDPLQAQKIDRIKSLLEVPCAERTDKMCLELMSFTKDFKLFENIAMSLEHQNICSSMTMVKFSPGEVIVKQDDPGDSFFYILHGSVNIRLKMQIDTGMKGDKEVKKLTVEKNLGLLKDGETFGELALLYGTPRTATISAVTTTHLIKIEKDSFDKYVKNLFENQLQDRIEFLQICPIFNKVEKDSLIKLGIRTEMKQFNTGKLILDQGIKTDLIYIIRRGTVKVTKEIQFVKDDRKLKKERNIKNHRIAFTNFEDLNNRQQHDNDQLLELLSLGPSADDLKEGNYITKEITLETLKIGDIFPSYYSINYSYLDVKFIADNPCDLIVIKLSDIQEIVSDTYDFIKKYAKPYPGDEFLRKFYYYNDAWLKYKHTLKFNILADSLNKKSQKTHDMRAKLFKRKDLNSVKLPAIFGNKNIKLGKGKKS